MPTVTEWLSIRTLTESKKWITAERTLMRQPYIYDFDDAFYLKYRTGRLGGLRGVLGAKFDSVMRGAAAITAGNKVLATDARDTHIADARLIFNALDQSGEIRTLQSDVHSLDTTALGKFDLVLCFGLIYHLENPIGALRKAFELCKNVCLIETQIAPGQSGMVDYGSYRFVKQIEASFVVIDETHETHGSEASTQGICLIPNLDGLIWILGKIGFSRVEAVPVPADGYEQLLYGKRAMLAAYR